ncbi:cobalamin-binding protein [Luteibacter aegosomatissinici]|uniref:cobalamin-binding protein n=1 Tax=Luteibacter aegosomatissinici TaxID=2911539 RepID=UPI001FFAFE65|nr:cobalamin-binding protein [Luteibacter aegosomatissinici]UPG94723.1 cobalamin-binding protein [Luteibacter aegosomatissinici]
MIRHLACLALFLAGPVSAAVSVTDDAGHTVTLQAPAHRIVSLAPNITDTLYAAGAGNFVVGTSRFSEHPQAAQRIPVVGDATMLDLERIVALRPDVIMVWKSGTPAAQVEKLARLGIPIYYAETTRLADIPAATRRLGQLAGTTPVAEANAHAFAQALDGLRRTFAGKKRVRVFFQVWDRPLMTVGRAQMISDALDLCGGQNIFDDLSQAAPTVGREAVLARRPDVIMTAGGDGDSLGAWTQAESLPAVRHGNVMVIDAPTLALPSPSILPSVRTLCLKLDEARQRTP